MNKNGIERALYVAKVAHLQHYDGSFSRLYFGNEFCQRLIPTAKDLEQVVDLVSENNLGFTFATPYVTDEGLIILEPLFREIEVRKPGSEVVFNDWGVLRILNERYPDLEPVMGRLLNKMKRGPRLMNLLGTLPQATVKYFRSCSLDVPLYQHFLFVNRVKRVELDNLLQGIDLDLSRSGISISLYTPYAYITTTRLCLAISREVHGKEDEIGIFPCKKECQEYSFQLSHASMPLPLIRKGNTVFFRSEVMQEGLEKKGIDRVVFEPEIPI